MSRDDYLQILRDNLTNMSDDEKDDVIRYYLKYFISSGNEQAAMEELGRPESLADRLCGTNNFRKEMEKTGMGGAAGSYAGESQYGSQCAYRTEGAYQSQGNYNSAYNSEGTYSSEGAYRSDSVYRSTSEGVYETRRRKLSAGKIIALICTFPIWLPIAITAMALIFSAVITVGALAFGLFVAFAAMVLAGIVSVIVGFATLGKSIADGLLISGLGVLVAGLGIIFFFLGQFAVKGIKGIFTAIRARRM